MRDGISEILASYAATAPKASAEADAATKNIVLDSLGVALGAVDHPAVEVARTYARAHDRPGGALVWATSDRVHPEAATLANGCLLRCYDYNDVHFGVRQGGHPSDTLAGLLAVAETSGVTGPDLLIAIQVAYEVTFTLMDAITLGKRGWDYVTHTAIGATCGLGRLRKLPAQVIEEAIAITIAPHLALNAAESNELDEAGELTMWKRFNGADAVRQAVYAVALAESGARGVVRPFLGPVGLIEKVGAEPDVLEVVRALSDRHAPRRTHEVQLKVWPVGSRGQAAIAATLEARRRLRQGASLAAVRVYADEGAYKHLVRPEAWSPSSRTQADHSLPYIVAAAVRYGEVSSDSFTADAISDAELQDLLGRTTVEVDDALTEGSAGGFPARVELEDEEGNVVSATVRQAPGHLQNPMTDSQVDDKFVHLAVPALGADSAERLRSGVRNLEAVTDVAGLVRHLAVGGSR